MQAPQQMPHFHFEQLVEVATKAVGRTKLTDAEHENLMTCYRFLVQEVGRRLQGGQAVITGLN